jgi:hypothetical protein
MEVSGQFHAPGSFTHGEISPGINRIRGWVGPRECLDTVASSLVIILTDL